MGRKTYTIKNEKLYDAVFWSMASMLPSYVPLLINEVFGEKFTTKASVTFRSNKQVTRLPDGTLKRREADAFVTLSEVLGRLVEKDYHIECETEGRMGVSLRIVEYAAGFAFQSASRIKGGAEMVVPYSVVIFLRTSSTDMKKFKVRLRYPGGVVEYFVPVIKIKDYTLDELFDKKLLLLVPFYVFIFSNVDFAAMDEDTQQLKKLMDLLDDIFGRLTKLVEAGEIEPWQRDNIMLYTKMVLSKLTVKYTNLTEKVGDIMGVYIIKTEIDKAREKAWKQGKRLGKQQGRRQGRQQGRLQGRQQGRLQGERLGMDNMTQMMKFFFDRGRDEELREATENPKLMKELMAEYKSYANTSVGLPRKP